MNIDELLKPGVTVVQYQHDDGCPTLASQNIEECTCSEIDICPINVTDMSDEEIAAVLGGAR